MSKRICLVAVDVRSAHNIGSIFRTCDGLGVELFLVGICPRPRYDDDTRLPHVAKKAEKQIAKTALGAEKSVSWRYADTLLECKDILKREGFDIVAIEQTKNSRPLRDMSVKKDIALVVGREVEGLSGVEIKLCEDGEYEIPMEGTKESFNVSVAAGIAMYEAVRGAL